MNGSIPAGAGEPRCRRVRRRQTLGLSPRARGNHEERAALRILQGSIPAGAGEPASDDGAAAQTRVYPRGRGGTSDRAASPMLSKGLSPRARGNPRFRAPRGQDRGSIPAGAGEPEAFPPARHPDRVYPRGRGGTTYGSEDGDSNVGLSPRARGNPQLRRPDQGGAGSIPAGAGEPRRCARRNGFRRVYPRGRGGTAFPPARKEVEPGLSPRARGNPGKSARSNQRSGSIPAGAGEPLSEATRPFRRRVYPRGRGGTCKRSERV